MGGDWGAYATVYNGECMAIALSMDLICKHIGQIRDASIYVDNQAAIRAMTSWKVKPGHYLVDEYAWCHRQLARIRRVHPDARVRSGPWRDEETTMLTVTTNWYTPSFMNSKPGRLSGMINSIQSSLRLAGALATGCPTNGARGSSGSSVGGEKLIHSRMDGISAWGYAE